MADVGDEEAAEAEAKGNLEPKFAANGMEGER